MRALLHASGKTYAVFGLARSGLAAARALRAGGAAVKLWDDNAAARQAAEALGFEPTPLDATALRGAAALILAPGVPLTHPAPHPVAAAAHAAGIPVIGDIELLLREARPLVYGITGTNGKSTTSALLAHVLAGAGRPVALGGNIGMPVLDLEAPQDAAYVLEMSSYQLDLTPSWQARIALLLNIAPDHLDRHGTMENYAAVKARIFQNQGPGDTAIIGVDDDHCRAIHGRLAGERNGRFLVAVSAERILSQGVSAVDGQLYMDAKPVADLGRFPSLPGQHNGQNIAAAFAAARAAGVADAAILGAIATFPGLPHRLEQVGSIGGIACVNDSKATNAEAAAKALACYPAIYWIAGGRAKSDGIAALKPYFPRLRHAFLIGEAAQEFAKTLGDVPHTMSGTLDRAFDGAARLAQAERPPGAVILLSPACASFDQFKSFEHRGDEFRRLVAARNDNGEAAA